MNNMNKLLNFNFTLFYFYDQLKIKVIKKIRSIKRIMF